MDVRNGLVTEGEARQYAQDAWMERAQLAHQREDELLAELEYLRHEMMRLTGGFLVTDLLFSDTYENGGGI